MFPFGGGFDPSKATADAIARRHFEKQNADNKKAEALAKEKSDTLEKVKQLEQAAATELARLANVKTLNTHAILALESGNLPAIIELFDKLKVEDRTLFNAAFPLLKALEKQNFVMTDYLLDQGFSCDVWEDYVEEDKHPELVAKLRAALAKPATNRLGM